MSDLIKVKDFAILNFEETLAVFAPVKTWDDLHGVEVPTLRYFKNKHGDKKILAFIKASISNTLDFLNVKLSMSKPQVETTASLILEEYNWLTIPDISMCFKKAMLGEYGKLYSAIDGQIILGWFKQYALDRSNAMEDLSLKKHYEAKKQVNVHPEVLAAFKGIVEAKKQVEEVSVLGPSEKEQLAWRIFDKIHGNEQEYVPETNIAIIKYHGQYYTKESWPKFFVENIFPNNKELAEMEAILNEKPIKQSK